MDLSRATTCELYDELKAREGVEAMEVDPFDAYSVITKNKTKEDTGPAGILIVWD